MQLKLHMKTMDTNVDIAFFRSQIMTESEIFSLLSDAFPRFIITVACNWRCAMMPRKISRYTLILIEE